MNAQADGKNLAGAVKAQPWWRNAYCWLVISGPLIVVVAGIGTMVIAYGGADAMSSAYTVDQAALRQQAAAAVSMRPAELGRNHDVLASPVAVQAH